MFSKSNIIRLALWACLAATWLPTGDSPVAPAQAKAAEVVRVGPIVGGPIVRVGPVCPQPWYARYHFRYGYGYRTWRWFHWCR